MPALDVSELLTDPDFVTTFDIVRRTQTVDSHGRAVNAESTIKSVVGAVTAGSSGWLRWLNRSPGYGASSRAITVYAKTRLYDTTSGRLPDLVVWKGTRYIVDKVNDYSEFGQGFYFADCSVVDPVQSA